MNNQQPIALSNHFADMALEDYDGLLATGKGPNLQRLAVRTVAQAAVLRALEATKRNQE